MIDNQKLAKQIKQGDIRAYELLFKTYYQALCNFANTYLNNIDESEDLVQEVFVKIWDIRNELKVTTSIKSYLFQAVKNTCFNHLKHQKVQNKHTEHLFHQSDSTVEPSNQIESKQLSLLIDEAIEKMPEKRREIFLLSREEGLKYKEVAKKLNISVKTVETQMGLALKHLRIELKSYLPIIAMNFMCSLFFELLLQGNPILNCLIFV